MKKEENVFFVGVQKPVELRRTILESSKQTIGVMRRFEAFRMVRDEKQKQIILLKKNILELNKLVNKFRSELPRTPIRVHHNTKIAKAKATEKELKDIQKIKPKLSKQEKKNIAKHAKEEKEIHRLESELDKIESKLNKMGF